MRSSFATVLVTSTLLAAGCGDSRLPGQAGNDSSLVGGPCETNDDCDKRLCQPTRSTASFPGGTCTVSCGSDDDCPDGSQCAGLLSGWVCLVSCQADEDCRQEYSCQDLPRPGGSDTGTIRACLGAETP